MATVALDCYSSRCLHGNSLQPWSLGAGVIRKTTQRKVCFKDTNEFVQENVKGGLSGLRELQYLHDVPNMVQQYAKQTHTGTQKHMYGFSLLCLFVTSYLVLDPRGE